MVQILATIQNKKNPYWDFFVLEPSRGFEPRTTTLPWWCSTN